MFDISPTAYLARSPKPSSSLYPESKEHKVDRFYQMLSLTTGLASKVLLPLMQKRMREFAKKVMQVDDSYNNLSDEDLLHQAQKLGGYLRRQEFDQQDNLVKLFSLIREVSFRKTGMRHFHTQVMAGWAIYHGQIAEMATGEGKTLSIVLPAAAAALAGIPVHVITVNDYLTQRDAELLMPVYSALGLSVGVIVQGLDSQARKLAYDCDVTYCTNKELAFDYLKDRLVLGNRPGDIRIQLQHFFESKQGSRKSLLRGLHFAIVDEADSVLIDECRTPLILSGQTDIQLDESLIKASLSLAEQMIENNHYRINEAIRTVELTAKGEDFISQAVSAAPDVWDSQFICEDLTYKALTALKIFKRDEDYLVNDGKVEIIDEYTGRAMSGRQWSKGLHQLVEAKEGCELSEERQTLSRISYQRFFRRYKRLAGMTGTAKEARSELWTVYRLSTLDIPTYKPSRRVTEASRIFHDLDSKWKHVVARVNKLYETNRPVLIGVRSVSASEHLSRLLREAKIPHQLLNARHEAEEADMVAKAGLPGQVMIATNMAGRGTDIKLADEVQVLGGLYVMIVERYEARRIDRQLIGRCARQGDPGSYTFILSLEDPLLEERRIGVLLNALKQMVLLSPYLVQRLGPLLQRLAQRRMERMHFKIRKQVLRSDQDLERTLSFSGYSE